MKNAQFVLFQRGHVVYNLLQKMKYLPVLLIITSISISVSNVFAEVPTKNSNNTVDTENPSLPLCTVPKIIIMCDTVLRKKIKQTKEMLDAFEKDMVKSGIEHASAKKNIQNWENLLRKMKISFGAECEKCTAFIIVLGFKLFKMEEHRKVEYPEINQIQETILEVFNYITYVYTLHCYRLEELQRAICNPKREMPKILDIRRHYLCHTDNKTFNDILNPKVSFKKSAMTLENLQKEINNGFNKLKNFSKKFGFDDDVCYEMLKSEAFQLIKDWQSQAENLLDN